MSFQPGSDLAQSVTGKVEDIVFIGSRSFYTVRLDDHAAVRVQVQHSKRHKLPSLGDTVSVFWDAENIVMLPA